MNDRMKMAIAELDGRPLRSDDDKLKEDKPSKKTVEYKEEAPKRKRAADFKDFNY